MEAVVRRVSEAWDSNCKDQRMEQDAGDAGEGQHRIEAGVEHQN